MIARARTAAAAIGALALALAAAGAVEAANVFEPREFETRTQELRYHDLIAELRCLVCQNQSIAESNADLAKDLRRLTYEMILAGRSDQEIVAYMVERYGDFVLYRPPFKPLTMLLWAGPFLLLAAGLWLLWRQVCAGPRTGTHDAALDAAGRDRVQAALEESDADRGESGR